MECSFGVMLANQVTNRANQDTIHKKRQFRRTDESGERDKTMRTAQRCL